jgi:hypothetical protein
MSIGDIRVLDAGAFGQIGAKICNVASGASTIYPGEPVVRALGGVTVTAAATNTPAVGTDYVVGIATSTSTNTATATGIVYVQPAVPGVIYGMKPAVAATWDTQAEYDALVGKRVLIDLTSSSYTILAADSVNNGCVIEALDIKKTPGTVAFSIRRGCTDLA